MKKNSIKSVNTNHVYYDKKQNVILLKEKDEKWFPINFQWIPVVKLNNELNLKINKMKNIAILPIIFLLIGITSCSDDDLITGSGNTISEFRSVSNFSKINSEGVFDITIIQGNTQSVEIIADDNIIHKVKTKVEDNELKLYLDDDSNYRDIITEVNITVLSINSIKNSGTGDITILDVDTTDNFNVYNSGTGDISIIGSANNLTLKNEGTGNFEGFLFTINDCNVNIVGSGDCEVNVINELKVAIEGSGDVYYMGSPSIEADITGSGKIVNSN